MTVIKGLARAEQIYQDREKRAKELKAEGKKIAGYLCCYPPLEIMTSLGYMPIRIMGEMDEPLTEADTYLPTVMCAFYRSVLDVAMKGRYDYLDAFIGAHACDGAERVSYVWRSYLKSPCSFYLDIPHTNHAAAIEFFKKQLFYLKEELEKTAGKKATAAMIKEAVTLHNKQRSLVRQLYELNKQDPPLVSGSEMLQVMIAIMCIPPEEGNVLLEEVIEEVKGRAEGPKKKKGRILIWGSLIDNIAFTKLIEDCGLNIVIDDTAIGTRSFWIDVDETEDPFDGLAIRYLDKIVCPRTFRDTKNTRMEDLDNRFSYLKKMIKDWNVNGVYMNIIRNCDIHGYEISEVRDYFEEMGLPVLVIEQDYSTTALEPLRTRFQAFAESIN
ncbi:2-hydroxyacyl-CoA dehydratase subunit D [Desulfoscipio geothermicus]|uniref:Benzoyl-CoA reductase, subunit C n=1 Tax=Desulfoscipio geothermicus DSM 3669 TaxID=1121426 RepID=A0A1I6CQI5_9FIRM|nr:2-hydroxyacyl-CoA dehydratase family protein [Desulfoscipio geothermicus]SFQ95456.1 benzoyl-CoA reductase, subunit C [Desulfoscipio geothermicus DSM 3669]